MHLKTSKKTSYSFRKNPNKFWFGTAFFNFQMRIALPDRSRGVPSMAVLWHKNQQRNTWKSTRSIPGFPCHRQPRVGPGLVPCARGKILGDQLLKSLGKLRTGISMFVLSCYMGATLLPIIVEDAIRLPSYIRLLPAENKMHPESVNQGVHQFTPPSWDSWLVIFSYFCDFSEFIQKC